MGKQGKKPVVAIDFKSNKEVGQFGSVMAACRGLNLDRASVHRCLSGEYNHTHGYTFKYI